MIMIIGGSYQGKLDFARKHFHLTDAEIQICDENTEALDPTHRCVAYIDRFALNRVRAGAEPADAFREAPEAYADSILIANDVSCGVVPMDATLRAWREASGRMNNYIAGRADEVWRLFCGIPQRIK